MPDLVQPEHSAGQVGHGFPDRIVHDDQPGMSARIERLEARRRLFEQPQYRVGNLHQTESFACVVVAIYSCSGATTTDLATQPIMIGWARRIMIRLEGPAHARVPTWNHQFAERIEEFDIFWFEEPVAPDDYEGHRRLAEKTSIPIATGENEYTRYGFRDLIEHNSAAILNADAKVLGGVTEWMKVAALAQAHDLDVAPHGSQDIHIHLVSAISNGLILEFYRDTFDPMWGRVYHHTLRVNADGTVSPPDVPGHGAEPNYAELEPYRVGRERVAVH